MKLGKKIFIAIGIAAIAYITHKSTKLLFAVKGISEDLPEFVKNSFGERPKFTMRIIFNKCSIILDLKKETIKKNQDLEEEIYEYIERFYPEISKLKLSVEVRERIEIDEVEDDEETEEVTEEETEDLVEDQETEEVEESEE